jgi:selenide, water dikinase
LVIMKNLVLIGGGHSHAIALRLFGLHPLPDDVALTLITDVLDTPYSGMLPGYVAGFYTFSECHIQLHHLARFAQARLVVDRAIGLDLPSKQVICQEHAPIAFDWLSIDIGSTPAMAAVPGAAEYAIPAKPVPQFLAAWDRLITSLPGDRPLRLGIVGGGAGGVELALTMQARLRRLFQARGASPDLVEIHLFHRQVNLMTGYPNSVGKCFDRLLRQRGIQLHLGETVRQIAGISATSAPSGDGDTPPLEKMISCESGSIAICTDIFWVTEAIAPTWLQASGLATDKRGFILVNDTLQSISNSDIFATGDIATAIHHPRPKAGVFAVRQGKPLFENLRAIALGQPIRPFYPQTRHLALIGTGEARAVAAWGRYCLGPLAWLWHWKDWIDRRFVAQFTNLPESGSDNMHTEKINCIHSNDEFS